MTKKRDLVLPFINFCSVSRCRFWSHKIVRTTATIVTMLRSATVKCNEYENFHIHEVIFSLPLLFSVICIKLKTAKGKIITRKSPSCISSRHTWFYSTISIILWCFYCLVCGEEGKRIRKLHLLHIPSWDGWFKVAVHNN